MNMADVLETFLAEMGFALLEYRGRGAFLPVAKLPPWFLEIWGDLQTATSLVTLAEKSPFLENFLLDAEAFWDSPNAPECQSETWVETSSAGREIPLQARALLLDGKRLLALFSPDPQFREQVKILQTARNALLDHERLNREIQKKEILLHCIVHDLSQPLSVMHVALDCLSEESISDRSKQFLKLGKLASNQQETMIRDILHTFSADLRATLDAGTEGNSSPDLLESARKTMTSLGPTFEAKGVHLSLSSTVDQAAKWPARAEGSRLQRIFSNLLENALRYTPPGARVTVGVEAEGEFLKAFVDDEGPGLPKDLRPEQIFGLFMKGKQSGGKAGLGLYFCRITVERWGGSIGCVTLPEKGSRFWFRLPRAAVQTAETSFAVKTNSEASGTDKELVSVRPMRILFADDQKDIRTLTTYQLKRHGHKVVAAKNGKEALKLFKPASFDVILLDQEMPGMTGDEVARTIRRTEAGKKTRSFLVASTGNVGAEDVQRLKQAGFDHVLGKPFCLEDLNAILASSPAATTPAAPPRTTPPAQANFTEILARIGGDEKLLKRMIGTFLRDTPKRVSGMASALRRKDAQALASLAHALKGSVSIFGAEAARKLAERLQELGRDSNLSPTAGILASLKEEIANLQANLRGYAKQTSARPEPNHARRQRAPRKRGKPRR
jgi:signal transduction histidine kinase/CheY-like chemotaxis protein